MTWLLLMGAGSFLVPAMIGLVIGGGRRRLVLAVIGVVFWAGSAIWAVTVGCADGYDCSPGVFLFAALAAIWIAGVGAAALVRSDRGRPGWRTAAAASILLLVVGTGFVFERHAYEIWRWGCPTQEELDRLRSAEEVIDEFEDGGLPLEPIPIPPAIPQRMPAYPGARAFRHVTPDAILYVVVCRNRCAIAGFRQGRPDGLGQRYRLGFVPGNNVVAWITDNGNRRAAVRLHEALGRVELTGSVDYGSRCYIR